MSKLQLKNQLLVTQNGIDPLTGTPLAFQQRLNDTHRKIPKAKGGTYKKKNNTILTTPLAHMAKHGTLRERVEALEELKSVFDDRVQTMRLRNKINNQLLAYQRRTDHLNPATVAFLEKQLEPIQERFDAQTRVLAKLVRSMDDLLVQAALKVTGLGEIGIAALRVYVDLEKASTPSALWKYAGLHTSANDRYNKGEASGGNKTLRTVLYTVAESMMKNKKCAYRLIYDRVKQRLGASKKIIKSRNTQGKQVEVEWNKTMPCHRHGAALRAIMKQLLADYWLVGREIMGLPLTTPYVQGVLGHTDISPPNERGW
jgi:hypothetical protein